MGYIYKITNQINGKSYIGKTERTVEERWKNHQRNIKKLGDRLPLYKALKKYGIENFSIETLEECDNLILDEREIYWIDYFHTYGQGYNCTGGGEGGIKDYHEDIDEIIQRYLNGERLDLLCKEYKHDYTSIRSKIEAKGVKIDTHAGPKKLSKSVIAIDPKTKEIIAIYESISAAARAICQEGKNPKAIVNHICKYKNTKTISHGFLWETLEKEELK